MPNEIETPTESIESPESADPIAVTPTPKAPKKSKAESNRINGAKSKGPKTDAGKSISAQNALRHGEYAKNLTLNQENDEVFIRNLAALEAEFKPQTEFEADLILTMAHARWRTIRMWNFEKVTLDHAIAAATRNNSDPNATTPDVVAVAWQQLSDNTAALRMIDRHEARYERAFNRALSQLLKYRATREAAQKRNTKTEGTNPNNPQKAAFPASRPRNPRPVFIENTARERRLRRIGARIINSTRRNPVIYPDPANLRNQPTDKLR